MKHNTLSATASAEASSTPGERQSSRHVSPGVSALEPFYDRRSKRKKRTNPEAIIQRAVADHLRVRAVDGVVWWHTPNGAHLGGKRRKLANGGSFPIQIVELKRQGFRTGVSDILVLHNGYLYALELKAPGETASVEQMKFLADINAAGGYGVVAEGLNEALACLECWGILRKSA